MMTKSIAVFILLTRPTDCLFESRLRVARSDPPERAVPALLARQAFRIAGMPRLSSAARKADASYGLEM
jgi:hypothetical protein